MPAAEQLLKDAYFERSIFSISQHLQKFPGNRITYPGMRKLVSSRLFTRKDARPLFEVLESRGIITLHKRFVEINDEKCIPKPSIRTPISLLDVEMKLRGFSPRTIKTYLFINQKFLEFVRKRPEQIEENDVKNYLSKKISEGLSPATSANLPNSYSGLGNAWMGVRTNRTGRLIRKNNK